ncbi:MAG: hypothetical protein CBD97_02745 [Pelagibacteraceae bacterium TMED237]|nr:MAG: hypothetical protein CBD97_02745 [Pelagibacteraceae bacterium TMED237]|tara:strand:+ start:1594 stop:2349 length:756 start_codon:yes stop_codon:yes gene_type:complete
MIVIDIGNTNAVFGIYSNKKLNKIFRINTEKEISKRKLMLINFLKKRKIFFDKSDNKICILSSVVPSLNSIIKNYFVKNKFKFHIITAKNLPFKTKINYNLNQIGSDRLANFIFLFNKKIKNCIIIDFGTATTFDVIKNNEYFGGLIFPGINLSMNTLIKNAELLKVTKISKSKKVVNRNTSASIKSGFYFGYLHAINGIIKQINKENNFKPKIYITGGLGKIFKDKILFNPIYKENLTLEGIREIGNKYL